MTPVLFHGPEARDRAVARGQEIGRPLTDPIGDQGLKVDDSRRIVRLTSSSGLGDKPPSLVVGPLDQATPEAADALLKTLEDMQTGPVRLVLWCDYLNEVMPTIRSRCRAVWCPAGPTHLGQLAYMEEPAEELCRAVLSQDSSRILSVLDEHRSEWPDLLRALCEALSQHSGGEHHVVALNTWMRVREVLDGRGSFLVAVDALLPEAA